MKISYIILTHNRCAAVLHTLEQVHSRPPATDGQWETWVVDNGSTDGTREAIAQAFPQVKLICRPKNEGVWARHYAIEQATGKYICLLDDDSYPLEDATARSVRFLDARPESASVTGSLVLPDGSQEASALPMIPANGAVCIRRSALLEIGGFRFCKSFQRQAEEYELAIRLIDAGYHLHRFEDLVYCHKKSVAGARPSAQVHRLDMRNNLVIADRYLPTKLRRAYQRDWTMRYGAIAKHKGFAKAAKRGLWEARIWSAWESLRHRKPAGEKTIEAVFALDQQAQLVANWATQHRIRRVVIADFSKNLYATYRACKNANLNIEAVADNNTAFSGMRYRGTWIKDDPCAFGTSSDGVVLSNVNPAQIDARMDQLRARFDGPILRLWQPQRLADLDEPRHHETTPIAEQHKHMPIAPAVVEL